jgi:hypothetical protein
MIEKYGALFVEAISLLSEAKWLCAPFQIPEGQKPVSRDTINTTAIVGITTMRRACIMSDMDSVLPELDRLTNTIIPIFPGAPVCDNVGVAEGIKHLISRVKDELGSKSFFRIDQSDVPLFTEHPFGEVVSVKFGKATEDISEAAKCLALKRGTACVFHLMRVMEIGVQALGKRLKVQIDVKNEPWNQIMMHVHNKISGSPNGSVPGMPHKTAAQKRRKLQYTAVAAYLHNVRLAWRNEVMHPKQTYTLEEAHDIYNATYKFMDHLARLR